jgi:hypothetical protein
MTSYNDLETDLKNAVAMEDSKTIALINPAINFGVWLASALYEPEVQKSISNLTAVSTAGYISIATMTRMLRMDHLYNSTGGGAMYPMSYDQMKSAYIPAGDALFWTTYGQRLYYAPTPSSNQTLNAHYLQYPARISAGEDLPFDEYEDFILTAAIQYVWATQEEVENVDMWAKLTGALNTGGASIGLTKQIMEREGMDVNNLSRVIPKGSPPA